MRSASLILSLAVLASALDQKPLIPAQSSQPRPGVDEEQRPNIIVVLTDDQDLRLGSVEYMPLLQKHIIDAGTSYRSHYCTTAICCPSRVSLWTGRNAHNTNVTDVVPPYGGYPKFISQGFNDAYLPVWLQDAGYSTYYTGKLFNSHTVSNWDSPRPAGWTSSDFLLDPHTYDYLNATFQRNDEPPVSHEGEYSTDLIAEKAYGLLDEAVNTTNPFFLTIAPIAPHANIDPSGMGTGVYGSPGVHMTAPIPAERHKHLFPGVKVPRTANFNPESPSGASWIKHLAQLTPETIEYNDEFYRARLQALQAVDEMILGLVDRLDDHGILDNTYIIYTSDNGYHISQHRLPPGKECGFEEDIHIPLFIRGPGVPAAAKADIVTAHTDLAPTILQIAEGDWRRADLDGSPIPLNRKDIRASRRSRSEHVNVEFWGRSLPEGDFGFSLDDGKVVNYGANNTYKAIRIIGDRYNLYYSVWCTNEHELYDLNVDPYQMHNLYPTMAPLDLPYPLPSLYSPVRTISPTFPPLERLLPRLDALLMVTKTCKGQTCVDPWSVLHPQGNVHNLEHALRREYDGFYKSLDKVWGVKFSRCELGYIEDSEGPFIREGFRGYARSRSSAKWSFSKTAEKVKNRVKKTKWGW